MICKVCGRTSANEEANFCDYCGASFRGINPDQMWKNEQGNDAKSNSNYSSSELYQQNQPTMEGGAIRPLWKDQTNGTDIAQEKPVSFIQWLGAMLLPYIPFVGAISYLVMLCLWAFGKDTSPTKKNWARARLVVIAIMLVIIVTFITYYMNDFISSGMTMEDYINNLYS